MKKQEKQRVVVMGRERLEHKVCGQTALGGVAEEVRLKWSKSFIYSLVKRQSYLSVSISWLAHSS